MKNIFSDVYARDEETNRQKKNLIATIVNIPVNAEIYNDDIVRNSEDRLGLGDYLIYQWSLSNGNPANFRDWAGISIDEGSITKELKNIEEDFWKNAFIEVRKKWNALYGDKSVFVKIKKNARDYYKKHYNKSPEEEYRFNERIKPIQDIIKKITSPSPYSICKPEQNLTDAAVKLMSSLANYIERLDLPMAGSAVFYPVMDLYSTVVSLSNKKSRSIEIGLVPNDELRNKSGVRDSEDSEYNIDRKAWKRYEELYGSSADSEVQNRSVMADRSAEAIKKQEEDSAKSTDGKPTKTPDEKLKELKYGKYRFPLQPENEHLFDDLEKSRKTLDIAFKTLNDDLKEFKFNTFKKNIFGDLSPNNVIEGLLEITKSMSDITDNFFPERITPENQQDNVYKIQGITIYKDGDPGWGKVGTLGKLRRDEDTVVWDKKNAESLAKNTIVDPSQILIDENQFKDTLTQNASIRHYNKQLHLSNPVDFKAENDVELQKNLQNLNALFEEQKSKANDIMMDYNSVLNTAKQFIEICSQIFFERWKIADSVAGDIRLTTIADPEAWHPRQGHLYDAVQDLVKQKKEEGFPWEKADEDELNGLMDDMKDISVVDPSDYRYDYVYYYEWQAQKWEFEQDTKKSSVKGNDIIKRRFNEIKADIIANPDDNSESEDFWGPVDDVLDNGEFFRNTNPEELKKEVSSVEDVIKNLTNGMTMIQPLSHDQANISNASKFRFYDLLSKRRAYHVYQLIKNNIDKINNIKIDGKESPTKITLSPQEKDHEETANETVVTFKSIVDYILYKNSIGTQGKGEQLDPRIVKFLDDATVEYARRIKEAENSKDILSRKLNVVNAFFRGGPKVVVLDKSTWKTIISRMKPSARRVLVNYINHNYEKKERSAAG